MVIFQFAMLVYQRGTLWLVNLAQVQLVHLPSYASDFHSIPNKPQDIIWSPSLLHSNITKNPPINLYRNARPVRSWCFTSRSNYHADIYIYILPQKSYKPISNIHFFDMCWYYPWLLKKRIVICVDIIHYVRYYLRSSLRFLRGLVIQAIVSWNFSSWRHGDEPIKKNGFWSPKTPWRSSYFYGDLMGFNGI